MTFSESFEWGPDGKPQEVGQSKHDPANKACQKNKFVPLFGPVDCTCPEREGKHRHPCCELTQEEEARFYKKVMNTDSSTVKTFTVRIPPSSEPKDAPTSVTGDEWSVNWKAIAAKKMMDNGVSPKTTAELIVSLDNLLTHHISAQRTHIKQALLGRLEKRFGDISYNDRRQEEACDEVVQELHGDIISIINEELA